MTGESNAFDRLPIAVAIEAVVGVAVAIAGRDARLVPTAGAVLTVPLGCYVLAFAAPAVAAALLAWAGARAAWA